MSETNTPSEIQINIKGPSELKLQIDISTDKTVLELKQAIAEKSDVEADRQRLIYSGRVLKDEDLLSVYKIQSSHTIHMVKGVSRSGGSNQSQAPQQLPTMQAGQNPTDPLTVLNGPMGHGVMAGFNPFTDMGLNPNDPNMMQGMMENPQFLQQMTSLMSNPAILDQVIASNPQLQAMGPQVRQMFQSEQFRTMMSNPEALRSMLQMSALLRQAQGGGADPFGSMFGGSGAGAFPAPGLPSYASGDAAAAQPGAGASPFNPSLYPPFPQPAGTAPGSTATSPASPGAGAGAGAGVAGAAGANPFASLAGLFGAPGAGAGAANPFGMVDPSLVQSILGGMGGGAPAAPADTRSPEERFQVQLQQLQDMGFSNAAQNVRALLATGGNVHSAIEYILGGGGL